MTWLPFAVLTALFESGKDVFGKKGLARSDEYVVAFAWRCFALPFLLPLLAFIEIPPLDGAFWAALAVGGGLNVATAVLYMRAIRASDLSLAVPMIAFTPLFLLLTSPLLLGEFPGPAGLAGVLLIVAGSYLLHLGEARRGLLAPLRALFAERGPRLMLLVALIWSVSANVDKIGLRHSSPLFWAVAVNAAIALGLFPLAAGRLRQARGNLRPLLATGFCGGLTTLCQMTAISLTLVPYVIAVKRSSAVFSVLWGHLLFGEKGMRARLAGVLTMLAGVLLITLGSV